MQVWNRGAARGSKHEPVNCPMSDTGLFRALKSMGITALHGVYASRKLTAVH